MKTKTLRKFCMSAFLFMLVVSISSPIFGQTTMGILPVNTTQVSTQMLNVTQWQNVSSQLQDHFILQLAGIGTVNKLSREHILLLLKEMPSPEPESLSAEAVKVISKKEQLDYLLKCSIESIQAVDKNILGTLRIIILEGNNGKVFWEKAVKINRIVSNPLVSEHILLTEVFKPSINEISKEIKALKY